METDEQGTTRREFVYGNGIDEPLNLNADLNWKK